MPVFFVLPTPYARVQLARSLPTSSTREGQFLAIHGSGASGGAEPPRGGVRLSRHPWRGSDDFLSSAYFFGEISGHEACPKSRVTRAGRQSPRMAVSHPFLRAAGAGLVSPARFAPAGEPPANLPGQEPFLVDGPIVDSHPFPSSRLSGTGFPRPLRSRRAPVTEVVRARSIRGGRGFGFSGWPWPEAPSVIRR